MEDLKEIEYESGMSNTDIRDAINDNIKTQQKINKENDKKLGSIGSGVVILDNVIIGANSLEGVDSPKVYIGSSFFADVNSRIGTSAFIGENVYVGAESKIYKNVIIGTDTKINDNVSIGTNAKLGENAEILDSVIIGTTEYIEFGAKRVYIGSGAHVGKNTNIGTKVEIQENVVIGTSATIPAGTNCVYIGTGAYIAKNVTINSAVNIGASVSIGANSKIQESVNIGSTTNIGDHVSIGPSTTIQEAIRIGSSTYMGDYVSIGSSVAIVPNATIGTFYMTSHIGDTDTVIIGTNVIINNKTRIGMNFNRDEASPNIVSISTGVVIGSDAAGTFLSGIKVAIDEGVLIGSGIQLFGMPEYLKIKTNYGTAVLYYNA